MAAKRNRNRKRGVFRLRRRPKRPRRDNKLEYSHYLGSGENLAELLAMVERYGVSPEDTTIQRDYTWDDGHDVCLVFNYQEPEEDFQDRMVAYKKKLAVWQAWYDENEEEIKAEVARREESERKRIARAEEKAQEKAAREIVALEKQLARMKKDMKGKA